MSLKLVSFEISTQDEFYYATLKMLGEKVYDNPEHWPVEKYNDAQKTIVFKQVAATVDDVLEFTRILQGSFLKYIEGAKQEVKKLLKKDDIEFMIEGTVEYTSAGQESRFRIEVKGETITIQESENYIFFGTMYFSDYEEFCATETILCDNLGKLCPEEDFDPCCEYCVTYDKLYVNEYPPYGDKILADKRTKTGVVETISDEEEKEILGEDYEDFEREEAENWYYCLLTDKSLNSSEEQITNIAVCARDDMVNKWKGHDQTALKTLLLTGARVGINGNGKGVIVDSQKRLLDAVFAYDNETMENMYSEFTKPVSEDDYALLKLASEMGNFFAISFLNYILSFARINGALDNKLHKRLKKIFARNLSGVVT